MSAQRHLAAGVHSGLAADRRQGAPSCRLDRDGNKLSKAERYGHPSERPHYRSGLPPAAFEAVVCSFLRHGLAGTQPKVGGWQWDELQELNGAIDWAAWEREVLPAVLAAHGVAVPAGEAAPAGRPAAEPAVAHADLPVHPLVMQD